MKENRDRVWKKMGRAQGIKLGTLNIHGKSYSDKKSKFKDIVTLMRKNKIAILGLQETHLVDDELERLRVAHPAMIIESNGVSTSKEGVAFMLNKDLVRGKTWQHTVLIPGRASRLQFDVGDENGLDIVLVYAPNAVGEKLEFINQLSEVMGNLRLVEPVMMGDFNFVEDDIDRFPIRKDDNRLTEKFDSLKVKYKWVDGWRIHNPTNRNYTFFQEGTGSRSRIDRIYTTKDLYVYAYNWDIMASGRISDHDLVYVEILKKGLPFIGEGPWRMRLDLIEYQPFRTKIKKLLNETSGKLDEYKGSLEAGEPVEELRKKDTPQTIWLNFKSKLGVVAQNEQKSRRKILHKEKKSMAKKINELLNVNSASAAAVIENERAIKELRKRLKESGELEHTKLQQAAEARFKHFGEKCTKYWFNLNKEVERQECMLALYDRDGNLHTETKVMCEIASEYHQNLQREPEWTPAREKAILDMLDQVEAKLSPDEVNMFEQTTTLGELCDALKASNNGTAPGLDGIPYEFYKSFQEEAEKHKGSEDQHNIPSIMEMYHVVVGDMEQWGIQIPDFTKGLMYLLYKKKDKREIENYRPLTLLNTDYKLYTKTIATKLGKVAGNLLHENQGGFVPGRGLFNQTRTTHMVVEYCEMTGQDGCIIALDQEKAYDKIDHSYLWRVLEKNGFPTAFINRVKEAYKDAKTVVMVNGVLPKPIDVKRGVRQGDGMSCLLYDLAIEPMCQKLRRSSLSGIEVKGLREKLLVSIFADDTLIYTKVGDDMEELSTIIETFCCASTAKFNIHKTEYLPLGSKRFREQLLATRAMGDYRLPEGGTIVPDGTPMRTLGAWVGNHSDTIAQWNSVLSAQKRIMDRWSDTHPSYKGKELILKSLVMSKAFFLASVNGMPKDIEERMERNMRNFLWDNKRRGLMPWKEVISPRRVGGLNMPDIRSRLEAIELKWVKQWLLPEGSRPQWAYIMDEIIFQNVAKSPTLVDDLSKQNWLLQTWHESMAGNSKISPMIRNMLKVARDHNITLSAPKIGANVKKQVPIWYNWTITDNYRWNKKSTKCLRRHHGITTVGELFDFVNGVHPQMACNTRNECAEMSRQVLASLPDKYNPLFNTPRRDGLDHTPHRLEVNAAIDPAEQARIFNPDVTERESWNNMVRICGSLRTHKVRQATPPETPLPAYRTVRIEETHTEVYVKGLGRTDGTFGIGLWYGVGDERNSSVQMKPITKSNTLKGLLAVLLALESNPDGHVVIMSQSRDCVEGLTSKLTQWEDSNWLDVKYKSYWQRAASLARSRPGTTGFKWVKPRAEVEGMKEARKLAKTALALQEAIEVDITPLPQFRLKGARLQSLTLNQMYRLVLQKHQELPGGKSETTRKNVEGAIKKLREATGTVATPEDIWMGLKDPVESKAANFVWRLLHGKVRTGRYFTNIPRYSNLQWCPCGQLEEPEHILFDCDMFGVKELWEGIQRVWEKTSDNVWVTPDVEILRGIGAIRLTNPIDTKRYKILVSEAVWMIWKLRCCRAIGGDPLTLGLMQSKFKETLIKRMRVDFDVISLLPFIKRDREYQEFIAVWAREDLCTVDRKDNGNRTLLTCNEKLWETIRHI
jgi:exonuclease III